MDVTPHGPVETQVSLAQKGTSSPLPEIRIKAMYPHECWLGAIFFFYRMPVHTADTIAMLFWKFLSTLGLLEIRAPVSIFIY